MPKSKTASLTDQLAAAEKMVDLAIQTGDREAIEFALRKLRSLEAQRDLIDAKHAERGALGVFPEGTSLATAEVLDRRKRSAVVIGDVAQMPLLAPDKIACSNMVLRSALFGIWSSDKAGQTLFREPLASDNGVSILFTGYRLWQKDFLVLATILRLAGDDLGTPLHMSAWQLLKAMDLDDGKSNYEALIDSLTRLHAASVIIKHASGELALEGRLLVYESRDTAHGTRLILRVNKQWASLFGVANWTSIKYQQIASLGNKELAQWLSGVLLSHNGKRPIAITKLYELSGLTTEKRFFRRNVRQALVECVKAGILKEAYVNDKDEVAFTPAPSRRTSTLAKKHTQIG